MNVELLSITPDAEKLIENAGRTCYLSHDKAAAESVGKFIRMLILRGHESVLEHAAASFRVTGASRAFTHQLVRHRLCSFSQQSQRYVEETGFSSVTPASIKAHSEAYEIYQGHLAQVRAVYEKLRHMGIPKEDARFVLPNATVSEIVVSANFREWRHILKLRGHKSAQWEIRRFAVQVADILKGKAPSVFFDFEIRQDRVDFLATDEH